MVPESISELAPQPALLGYTEFHKGQERCYSDFCKTLPSGFPQCDSSWDSGPMPLCGSWASRASPPASLEAHEVRDYGFCHPSDCLMLGREKDQPQENAMTAEVGASHPQPQCLSLPGKGPEKQPSLSRECPRPMECTPLTRMTIQGRA